MRKAVYWFVGTMIIAWLGNYFYDSTKHIPVLAYATGILNWIWETIFLVLNYPIKFWIVVVFAIGLYLIYQVIKAAKEPKELPKPEWFNYKEGVLKRWIWRWNYEFRDGKWRIVDLIPFCPKDDVQLIYTGSLIPEYYCPKCQTKYNEYHEPLEFPKEAEVLISDKINKGTYPKP